MYLIFFYPQAHSPDTHSQTGFRSVATARQQTHGQQPRPRVCTHSVRALSAAPNSAANPFGSRRVCHSDVTAAPPMTEQLEPMEQRQCTPGKPLRRKRRSRGHSNGLEWETAPHGPKSTGNAAREEAKRGAARQKGGKVTAATNAAPERSHETHGLRYETSNLLKSQSFGLISSPQALHRLI